MSCLQCIERQANDVVFSKIKVFIVDDSPFFRTYLSHQLADDAQLAVCGYASSAKEALEGITKLQPDVITLDLQLPGVTGFELLRKIRSCADVPVLVISSMAEEARQSLEEGAAGYLVKVDTGKAGDLHNFVVMLQIKLKVLAGSRSRENPRPKTPAVRVQAPVHRKKGPEGGVFSEHIIAIGASLGGVEATQALLEALPPDMPGMVVVQHMPAGFTKSYAERLNQKTPFAVREAVSGDFLTNGTVLIAGGGRQLRVYRTAAGFQVRSVPGASVNGFCPSVDVLFYSVAAAAGAAAGGVILTGIGCDGAAGLKAMHDAGAHTWGQSAESCAVYGMPAAARQAGAVDEELPLQQIGSRLAAYFQINHE